VAQKRQLLFLCPKRHRRPGAGKKILWLEEGETADIEHGEGYVFSRHSSDMIKAQKEHFSGKKITFPSHKESIIAPWL
jgi:hypothetical protein